MLTCQSCIRRHVQIFTAHRGHPEFRNTTANLCAKTATRHISTHIREKFELDSPDSTYTNSREQWLQSRGQTPKWKSKEREAGPVNPRDKALKKHMTFLGDPLKLARDIQQHLREDRFEEAIEIVRYASKTDQCVVSWNHLIDWQMSKGMANGAWRTFNEMKKRAQHPDNHTFTILFRGFATCANHPNTLEKALSIYQSMKAPNSRVHPNKIHTNCILNICARAGNVDALFGIAADLPEKGFQAADNLTFTIILNAMREHAVRDTTGRISEEQRRVAIDKAILNGRHIWEDVVGRWRKGDIFIDEQLVCAMGRLLLAGEGPEDCDDVFSLIQQTMRILRPFPALGTPERDLHEPSRQTQKGEPVIDSDHDADQGQPTITEPGREENDSASNEFQVMVDPPPPNSQGAGGYVRPGNNTLSVVLEALQRSAMKGHTRHYWDIFTNEYGIRPDSSNYASILRILRVLRASSDALDVLLKMDSSLFQYKHFRLALSTCARGKNDPNAFSNAGKMLDLMQKNLREPDIPSLSSYLSVAIGADAAKDRKDFYETRQRRRDFSEIRQGRRDFSETSASDVPSPEELEEKFAAGRRIERALFRLQPCVVTIRSYLNYGDDKVNSPGILDAQSWWDAIPKEVYTDDVLGLFKRMNSAYDKLIFNGMTNRDRHSQYREQRGIISATVKKLQNKLFKKNVAERTILGKLSPRGLSRPGKWLERNSRSSREELEAVDPNSIQFSPVRRRDRNDGNEVHGNTWNLRYSKTA